LPKCRLIIGQCGVRLIDDAVARSRGTPHPVGELDQQTLKQILALTNAARDSMLEHGLRPICVTTDIEQRILNIKMRLDCAPQDNPITISCQALASGIIMSEPFTMQCHIGAIRQNCLHAKLHGETLFQFPS
jgi:hypothetical protein